ncbi:uncharacterized protein L3040_007891 [Drepanopeziza brunnea f. sp. 'multigermtubi']|uniref:uncharacterized protein n=1 Tax=Drepanopeziza brunnea f. sp. 'multigermtubi' TaxID=698441 RepID=UPI00239B8CE0|nr:hypothetical protein L3040_007891 [Drepanopeziza brunnea f. sp. 'multigermtubi']
MNKASEIFLGGQMAVVISRRGFVAPKTGRIARHAKRPETRATERLGFIETTRIILQNALAKALIETGRIVLPKMDIDQDEEKRLQDIGERVALDTLGSHRYAPIVAYLLPHAYQMRPLERRLIRSILEEEERARVDFEHFGRKLEAKMKGLSPADFSGIVKHRDMRSTKLFKWDLGIV